MITDDLERLAERGWHRDPAAVVNAALTEAFARRTSARRIRAVSMAAVSIAVLAGGVAALAARERSSSDSGSALGSATPTGSTIPSAAPPPPATDEASSDDVEPDATACDDFQPRYIGNGLTVALPITAALIEGGSTADPGPVHAATSMTFGFDDVRIQIGRRIDGDIVDEDGVAQRVDDGVVIFVRSDHADLRDCVLASASYDKADDEADD